MLPPPTLVSENYGVIFREMHDQITAKYFFKSIPLEFFRNSKIRHRVVAYLISRLSVTSVCMGLELNKAFKDEAAKRTRALEVAAGA